MTATDFFTLPVVCDTGPILALARADLSGLLVNIFPTVLVPEAVAAELLAKDTPDREQVSRALGGVQIVALKKPVDPLLAAELDSGEAAVIQMAGEQGIGQVLIDERKARRVAALVYRLQVRGSAALLIEAKSRGLITSVGPALTAMAAGGYFIGPKLRAECLRRAGESTDVVS